MAICKLINSPGSLWLVSRSRANHTSPSAHRAPQWRPRQLLEEEVKGPPFLFPYRIRWACIGIRGLAVCGCYCRAAAATMSTLDFGKLFLTRGLVVTCIMAKILGALVALGRGCASYLLDVAAFPATCARSMTKNPSANLASD